MERREKDETLPNANFRGKKEKRNAYRRLKDNRKEDAGAWK